MSNLDVAYYGDDFTGSTDVLEVLATAGIDTVLFLERPTQVCLQRFSHCRAIGLAGKSRSQTPAWMDAHLPEEFAWLKSLGARLCHYKVCSTFDSSPGIGSIGRAIDIGAAIFQSKYVPVVAGVPALRRYVVFGNLFATADGETFRIDRHPTMSRHPVTPMDEGDLRLHLGRQTSRRIGLIDLMALHSDDRGERLDRIVAGGAEIVLMDTLDDASLAAVGELLWRPGSAQPFVAGSSGVEYALVAYLRPPRPAAEAAGPTDRIAVLSGSCSPVTARQIAWAGANGYATIPLDAARLAAGDSAPLRIAADSACAALADGRSTVLYSAGPGQARIELDAAGRETLAKLSGAAFQEILARSGVRRAVVAGGDTSSHTGVQLGIQALTFRMPLAPGAPLCRAYSSSPQWDGFEIVFKGGQCGGDDFFEQVRLGANPRS
jgi:3-oxoisoapionate kinase